MIGESDSEGEEEVLEETVILGGEAQGSEPESLGVVQALGSEPEPLTSPPDGWTRHLSKRYKDTSHPQGYEYFFCVKTGETRWAQSAPPKEARYDPALFYQSPKAALTDDEKRELVALSDGHLKLASAESVEYFCDRQKKWAFKTNPALGLELLCHLVRVNQRPLALCQEHIRRMPNPDKVLKEGKGIYTEKKHLMQGVAGQKKVTWTHEEYAHAGMQLMYLSLKSWQRFTETWALLERAGRLGLLEPHRPGGAFAGKPVRVLSIGGGPAYELVAFERFFRRYACDSAPLQLMSLDIMPGWRPFVEELDMAFGVYDIKGNAGMLEVAAGVDQQRGATSFPAHEGVTYVLISYVMIYVSTNEVCNMLARLLAAGRGSGGGPHGAYCILVSERGEETHSLRMMEERGCQVHRLIDQTYGVDERQSVWLDPATRLKPPADPGAIPTTFPNVPFEEQKKRKRKAW